MIPYKFDEIENKYGQRIYMFSKQAGNTEIEKCINFITKMCVGFDRYDTKVVGGISPNDDISVVVTAKSSFEVFNSSGEKIAECDEVGHRINSLVDIYDDLYDLGFEI